MSTTQRLPGATRRARQLRQQDNPAEASMWVAMKDRRLGGFKFVRQFPIGPYFADFLCREGKLVVEIDGSQHVDCATDRVRDEFMRRLGYSVLRVWSGDVMRNRDGVCETILLVLKGEFKADTVAADLRFVSGLPLT